MIRSFRSRALRDFFLNDDPRGIRPDLIERIRGRLQALHRAKSLDDLRVPGWRLHGLHTRPVRYALAVNAVWLSAASGPYARMRNCQRQFPRVGMRLAIAQIMFEWESRDAVRVDLEQYH